MSEQAGQNCAEARLRKRRELGRLTLLVAIFSLLSSVRCTFPEYDLNRSGIGGMSVGVAGSAGAGAGVSGGGVAGGGGGAAQSGSTTNAGQTGSESELAGAGGGGSGDGGEPPIGGGPTCSGEQWPVAQCPSGCLTRYPAHCYDGDKSADETDVDCGGSCQGCSYETCEHDDDCLSGSCQALSAGGLGCHAPLTVSLTAQGVSRYVGSTNWKLVVRNTEPADGADFSLKDLKLRYYLARSGIVEPLLIESTQSSLLLSTGGSRALPLTSWSMERVEPVADAAYDAYIEIAFTETSRLFPGDGVELFQQLSTGVTGSSNFDQFANYSFKDTADPQFLHVTLFYRDKLIWGLEPRPANPRACFARAVNLNGDALRIASHDWQAAGDANLTTTGSPVTQNTATFPATTGDAATMLRTAIRLSAGQELDWPVESGTYLVYLHATSAGTDGSASSFNLQGSPPASSAGFRAQLVSNAGAWARIGPYRVSVTTGKLSIAVTKGALNLAGIELWYPE
jgi:hypothetical protein